MTGAQALKYSRFGGWLCASLALPIALSSPAQAQSRAPSPETCAANPQQAIAGYDYVLGTQAIGGRTRFGNGNPLLEQAGAIRAIGSNILKISLSRRAARHYGTEASADKAHTVLQYVKGSPVMQQALDMNFKYYQLWVHSFTPSNWRNGVSPEEAHAYYKEMYNLAAWLLTRYSGTGKVFLLGNWEGDWMLNGRHEPDIKPPTRAIKGMIDWLNIRQKAIDDAKAAVPHKDVQLYQYVEVNLVKRALKGKPSVAYSVLPKTNVDMVSYSSYEAIKGSHRPNLAAIKQPLTTIVHYLEGQLHPKAGLPFERRVFIGEFGYHANAAKPMTVKQQFLKSRYVMQAAIRLHLPFALIWQLNNNEYALNGTSKEMSLVDESGHRRALYFLLQTYLHDMKGFVADTCRQTGHVPTRAAFTTKALEVLPTLSFKEMQRMAKQARKAGMPDPE